MTAHIQETRRININLYKTLTVDPKDSNGNVSIDLDYGIKIVGNQSSDFRYLLEAVVKAIAAFNESEPKTF